MVDLDVVTSLVEFWIRFESCVNRIPQRLDAGYQRKRGVKRLSCRKGGIGVN